MDLHKNGFAIYISYFFITSNSLKQNTAENFFDGILSPRWIKSEERCHIVDDSILTIWILKSQVCECVLVAFVFGYDCQNVNDQFTTALLRNSFFLTNEIVKALTYEFLKAILLLEALYLCSQYSLVPSNSINDIFGIFNKAEKEIKREQYVNMYVML